MLKLRIPFDLESLSDANTANHAFPSSSSDEEKSGLHTPSSLKRIPTLTTQTLVGPELDAVFNDDDISSFYTSEFHGAEDDQLERVPMVSKGPKCLVEVCSNGTLSQCMLRIGIASDIPHVL